MLPSVRSLQLCNNSRTALRFPSGCLSSCCGAIATPRLLFSPRRYSTAAVDKVVAKEKLEEGPPAARFNELGVQQISTRLHSQIFKMGSKPPPPELVELAQEHLNRHDLYGKTSDASPSIDLDLPGLQGDTLDEHFTKLGMEVSDPYLTMAKDFSLGGIPDPPIEWNRKSGWTRYSVDDGEPKVCSVDAPTEDAVVFDVEVLYRLSPFPIMACAASKDAWYSWLSPWLLEESKSQHHLIPFGDMNEPRVIVGHNVGFDRARVREEYDLIQSKNCFLDTMSLHVAVNGMCSRQRPMWMKHKKNRELREKVEKESHGPDLQTMLDAGLDENEEELWIRRSSINSLRDVAKFHCGIELDKEVRGRFGGRDSVDVLDNLQEFLNYCSRDVIATHQVYRKVLPEFLQVCPHPVSFAALRHLSSVILPVNRSWDTYVEVTDRAYRQASDGVKERLVELAKSTLEFKEEPEVYEKDEWLRQLDWSGQELKFLKLKKGETEPRPAKQKQPGMPKWYRDLCVGDTQINLSARTRISPILLKLQWDKHPLIWTGKFGWTFKVSREEAEKYKSSPLVQCDLSDEKNEVIRNDIDNVYYKLPHKDGPGSRCSTPLAKGYLQYFESQTLSSEYPLAREALEMNAACSYWISARDRIRSQMVVYRSDLERAEGMEGVEKAEEGMDEFGIILPQLIPMGTITRRAVERTWLTASNAKKHRLGSELKAKVIAPPGYAFVGADVDSQELWIASLLGDAQFKIHGGNALGFMTLEGTKANGTDLHSKTAKILNISRDNAKVFNYGRIYGAGVGFASTLLRAFNPAITDSKCAEIASDLYSKTKGQQALRSSLGAGRFWHGGTESFVFNTLEKFADQERPRTPVLGAGITEALMRRNLSRNGFLPSRINWAIQSSGVDYLHLLVVAMDYLIRKFGLQARLAITVHDEIRYLVKWEHRYKAAMALQVANVWTRAMFSEQIGINDLPQSCAFFSAVDIDHVLRKEVDMDCITPTNPTKINPGESLNIFELLGKENSLLDPATAKEIDFKGFEYVPRVPVMEGLQGGTDIYFMRAQICSESEELDAIADMARKYSPKPKKPRTIIAGNWSGTGTAAKKPTGAWGPPFTGTKFAKDSSVVQHQRPGTTANSMAGPSRPFSTQPDRRAGGQRGETTSRSSQGHVKGGSYYRSNV
ncbi:DNA polymerase family A-domain-containing protein [Tuber brumale]|nr:DNA polymerase family A-domain-containing protein [Tuber brumale]